MDVCYEVFHGVITMSFRSHIHGEKFFSKSVDKGISSFCVWGIRRVSLFGPISLCIMYGSRRTSSHRRRTSVTCLLFEGCLCWDFFLLCSVGYVNFLWPFENPNHYVFIMKIIFTEVICFLMKKSLQLNSTWYKYLRIFVTTKNVGFRVYFNENYNFFLIVWY